MLKKYTQIPHDLIEEDILSRLPVKSLFRFKVVCKQWKATISDPKFADTHLRRSKSSCNRLLAQQNNGRPHLTLIENDKFQLLSAVNYPPEEWLQGGVLCHCDGLYLMHYSFSHEAYILFNPSNRTCKTPSYPYNCSKPQQFGICYDPLVKDYKVVIGDRHHYAVFRCKTNSWSERKEMINAPSCNNLDAPSPFSVSFYWAFNYKKPNFIVLFDGRNEKFKIVSVPDRVDGVNFTHSVSSGDRLCLFSSYETVAVRNELQVMKKVGYGDEWMKLKVQLISGGEYDLKHFCWPCLTKIFLELQWAINYLLVCDESDRLLERIQNSSDLDCFNLFPYVENLFLL